MRKLPSPLPVIDKGVVIPPGVKRRRWNLLRVRTVSPWVGFVKKIKVGDSFVVHYFDKQTAIRYMKAARFDFLAVPLGNNEYRVWRTK